MKRDVISLSDHFDLRRLLRYTLPSIVMMIFTSIYGVVDGFFVSNFVGKSPFAAVNLVYPLILMLGCVGFMFGTGASALIAKTLGEGDGKKANELFSLAAVVAAISGVVLALIGFAVLRPFAVWMGAEGALLENSLIYGRILLAGLPFYVLQYEFQCLFATAQKPRLGLFVTVAAGVTNMVLDAVFVAVFEWGLVGAALATVLSQLVGGVTPLLYFAGKNTSLLHLGRFRFDGRALMQICTNGSSEFLSNVSSSLVSMLYNAQLMKYAGEDGIAAYGVLMYVQLIFLAVFIGFAVGSSPVVSYHYGARNRDEVHKLLTTSLKFIAVCSVLMLAAGQLLARPVTLLFAGYDEGLLEITLHAFAIFSFSFLFAGFSIYGSSFFTALNDGLTSAMISFLRTVVFQVAAVLIFPMIWDLDGIWFSIVAAEVMAILATVFFLLKKRKKYGY